jgi:pimeloyl-ACP methyl ester carboxylesterase
VAGVKKLLLIVLLLAGILAGLPELIPAQVADLGLRLERARGGMEYRTLQVGGETWHYLERGPADAEAVLIIHGFGGSKDNWSRFSHFLTAEYRVVVPDLPGFGESARHADWDYSLTSQRDPLHGFVEGLGLESFHLLGVSMGGQLSALYTHRYPEQVLTLGLLDSAGVMPPVESDYLRALNAGENPLVVDRPGDFDRLFDYIFHEKPFIPWPFRRAYAHRAVEQSAFNRTIFESLRAGTGSYRDPLESLLSDISQPVLIIWGEYDRIIDKSAIDVMQPLLPQAEIVILENTGHVPMLEKPEETARHYQAFIDRY